MQWVGWLLFAVLPGFAQGFDATRWGMTQAQVEACYPGRTWSPTCSDGTRSVSQLKLERDLDGVKVKVDFLFREDRLESVEIAPAAGGGLAAEGLDAGRRLLEGLVQRHGRPQEHEGPADGVESFRWHLPDTDLWASRSLTAAACGFTIQYLPRRR